MNQALQPSPVATADESWCRCWAGFQASGTCAWQAAPWLLQGTTRPAWWSCLPPSPSWTASALRAGPSPAVLSDPSNLKLTLTVFPPQVRQHACLLVSMVSPGATKLSNWQSSRRLTHLVSHTPPPPPPTQISPYLSEATHTQFLPARLPACKRYHQAAAGQLGVRWDGAGRFSARSPSGQ